MFFRNFIAYRFTQPFTHTAEELATALAEKLHRDPASQELSTYGFVPARDAGTDLVEHGGNGYMLIRAKKSSRILPSRVVREELSKKVEEIENSQMRKVYKKERDQLKDEIIVDLLPRAFVDHAGTQALILKEAGIILIETSSHARAEDMLSTMRDCLGSLPVRPINVKVAPTVSLTEAVRTNSASNNLHVLDQCDLRDTHEDGGIVKCKGQDLGSEEIGMHLATGKIVTSLAMAYSDKLSFVIDDKLTVKRIRFEDLLQEQAEQDGGDDAHGVFIASLVIMGGTFTELLRDLFEFFGGEEIPQSI